MFARGLGQNTFSLVLKYRNIKGEKVAFEVFSSQFKKSILVLAISKH